MNWEKCPSPELEINDLAFTKRDSELHFTWYWPKEVDFVYIYKAPANRFKNITELVEKDVTLYTREEYKAKQGFVDRFEAIGKYVYQFFPCQKQEGALHVYYQENENNLKYITTGKANILFSISYKKKLFKSCKNVRISIMTEVPLSKDLLVYVKKNGAVPISIEDGLKYPFLRDFPAGRTDLAEIMIEQNEFIRLFFTNGKESAEVYDLIPQ